MMRTLRRTRRAVRRATVATAVLAVMALTTAVVATSGPTQPLETATAQGASSLVCIELSSPDYVDTTCLFDYDDPSQDDIWPDLPLDIDVRTPVPGI
jgi:hypothetical protein